jgi:hypothetical protein
MNGMKPPDAPRTGAEPKILAAPGRHVAKIPKAVICVLSFFREKAILLTMLIDV